MDRRGSGSIQMTVTTRGMPPLLMGRPVCSALVRRKQLARVRIGLSLGKFSVSPDVHDVPIPHYHHAVFHVLSVGNAMSHVDRRCPPVHHAMDVSWFVFSAC
jgi:hypothetical protein